MPATRDAEDRCNDDVPPLPGPNVAQGGKDLILFSLHLVTIFAAHLLCAVCDQPQATDNCHN